MDRSEWTDERLNDMVSRLDMQVEFLREEVRGLRAELREEIRSVRADMRVESSSVWRATLPSRRSH